ncbi:aminotransferase [Microbacteriaceae bacterium VKM Ac-2855]|nr:aminotransferase [Microbacteriaceae bacterium VKM Ac-2855]
MSITAELPRPDVSSARAAAIAAELFGVRGRLHELGSQQDRNFRLETADGTRWLLKISNPAFTRAEVEAQNAVMTSLHGGGLATPRPRLSFRGEEIAAVDLDGVTHLVRLLEFVDGTPLIDFDHLSVASARQLGTVAGRVSAALAGLRHEGLDRTLQWDLRRAETVVSDLLQHAPPERREFLRAAAGRAVARLSPLRDRLPTQPLHGDLTDDNVVCHADAIGRPIIDGIIDFGDASLGWRVAELAIACTAIFHHEPEQPFAVLETIAAFDSLVPLSDTEIAALWPLIVLRGAVLVVSGEQQIAADPGNRYADVAREREWTIFAVPAAVDIDVATAAIRARLGRTVVAPTPLHGSTRMLVVDSAPAQLDLGCSSRVLRDGAWLREPIALERRLLAKAAAANGCAVTRFGESRLTRSAVHRSGEPINTALGVEVHFAEGGHPLYAPFAATAHRRDDLVILDGAEHRVVIAGLSPEPLGAVASGAVIGRATDTVTIWLTVSGAEPPPLFVRPGEFSAWRTRCLDPAPLLGLISTAAPRPDSSAELARRDRAYDPLQSHYYASPPQIERGWAEHLIDTDGRHYLDMVNNVTVLGHGHPRLADAADDQWRMLNTNSRFHYDAVVELSERLLRTLPGSFDTVLLVNSGTEAVDLALRLTSAFTGRDDVMCVSESYHGWSLATDAVSTSVSDNPQAESTRPGWVHVTPAPNAYRGAHRGEDAGAAYAADTVAQLTELAAAGTPIGTFIAEPRHGNAGGIEVPAGYLAAVYAAVRAGGGVTISDEVQVGYGRQGDVFWGFQQHPGVVPDVVTVAKAMGNGHPLGAVITRRAIAESLAVQGTFFSSAGGSTLSSRLGTVILDIMEDEGLQANALRVGGLLTRRVLDLAQKHPLIGTVHGSGLYLGIELVRDRETLEPAREETAAVCERMLELGVIVQPTGDRQNVLKVKPPLCFTEESAEFFVAMLDQALRRGF